MNSHGDLGLTPTVFFEVLSRRWPGAREVGIRFCILELVYLEEGYSDYHNT